nr:hypothetical protein [Frankia sp. CcI49]
MQVGDSEGEAFWTKFLRRPTRPWPGRRSERCAAGPERTGAAAM